LNLLDRYIFKSALAICAGSMGLFAFLLMIGNVIRDLVPLVIAGQLAYAEAARLVLLMVPFVISYALPMGVLTGVLLTLGRLSADNEITAMRAAGISVARLARPILLLGALGAVVALRVNFESMPWAKLQYERELTASVRANPLSFIVPRTFIRDFPGYVVYVGDKKGGGFRDFWLWQMDPGRRVVRLVHAAEGSFSYNAAGNELILTLSQAAIETRNEKDPEDFTAAQPIGTFEKWEEVRLPLDRLFNKGGVRQKLRWMTYAELQAKEDSLSRGGGTAPERQRREKDRMEVSFVIQEKFNTALSVFSFALVGVPLGVRLSRRETSANLGIALLLALGYYFVNVAIGWLDRTPALRPDLLLWAPNLAFVGIAVQLFRRIDLRSR
jgi:lipopolysaccharide export system permease protein